MSWIKRSYLFSTSILIILAIFGYHMTGIYLFGLHIFPFIMYLFTFQAVFLLAFVHESNYKISIAKIELYLLLFILYILLSILWTSDTEATLIRVGVILPSIIVGLTISLTSHSLDDINYYVNSIKFFVGAVSILAVIAAIFNLTVLDIHWFNTEGYSRGWYSNRNDFSYFLSIVSPLFLFSVLNSRLSLRRRTGEFAIFLILTCIIISNGSRAVIAGHVIIMTSFTVYTRIHTGPFLQSYTYKSLYSMKKKFTVGWLLTIPILFFFFILISNPFTTEQSSLYVRWNLHVGAYDLATSNLLGVGIGGFSTAYGWLGLFPGSITPHSWFGQILGELGFVGIVAFLFIYGSLLDLLLNENKTDHELLPVALFVSLASFAVSGLAPSEVLRYQIHWIIIGICIGYLKL